MSESEVRRLESELRSVTDLAFHLYGTAFSAVNRVLGGTHEESELFVQDMIARMIQSGTVDIDDDDRLNIRKLAGLDS